MLLIAPLALGLREPGFAGGGAPQRDQTILQALREAFKYPSFQLLMAGYFVCGFQVVFIGVHMPSYLKDKGLSPQVASYALALIGLFNVFGTYIAGSLGQQLAKRKILAFIYLGRSVAIALFLWAPLSPLSVYVFSSVMGLLWLSTVPPTNATVAQIFGVAHLSMLGGFVFFSHQIGSFMGVWLGGLLYDRTGSYDIVWYIAIALGVFAALVNLPVREAPIARGPRSPAAAPEHDAAHPQAPRLRRRASRCCWPCLPCTRGPQILVTLADQIWACFNYACMKVYRDHRRLRRHWRRNGAPAARLPTARRLALVLAARNRDKLDAVAAQCRAFGAQALVAPTDVAVRGAVPRADRRGGARFGRIDALVNNAGVSAQALFAEVRPRTCTGTRR